MVFNTNKCPGLSPAPLTYLGGGCGSRPTSGVARLLSLVLRRVRQEDPGFRTTLTGLRDPTLKDRNLETRKWGSHLLLPNGKSINQLMLGFIPLSWPLRVSCAASTHQGTSDFLNNYYYEGMTLLCRGFTCAVQNMPRLGDGSWELMPSMKSQSREKQSKAAGEPALHSGTAVEYQQLGWSQRLSTHPFIPQRTSLPGRF